MEPELSAASILKVAYISVLILALLGQPVCLSAGKRDAPVFSRTNSGYLVRTGERLTVPEDPGARRRRFSYKRPVSGGRLVPGSLSPWKPVSGGIPGSVSGTIHVVMIRIAFEENSQGGFSSIRTNGDFDLSPYDSSIVDPTPHNKTYFNAQMQGLKNYYGFQSCEKLDISWDILPPGENDSYKLSDIADYGPGSYTNGWTTEMLVAFLHDAIVKVDDELSAAGYPVRLSDYDAIILVHAGADIQSDYNMDSPNDLPSFFAMLAGDDVIPVEGGATIIREVSVVPETTTQDGFYGGMASVLAHEFGHVLGLPDLYDTYYNIPIVGVWDQMDSGPQLGAYVEDRGEVIYVTGMIPSGLGAWSRYMLGWTEADTVRTFENNISLPAAEKCPSKVVRIEASNGEYFLLENRAVELDGLITGFVVDTVTGVVIGTANCLNCDPVIPDEIEWGELVNGYDILLPTESYIPETDGGPGILVWHIDEYFIENRWYSNIVNSRWPFGVSIVEGSGIRDLGDPYSSFRMGWYDDAFFEGNASEFSDSTIPASWSNWNVPTGVRIENISLRDTLMTLGAGVRGLRASKTFIPSPEIARNALLTLPGDFRTLVIDECGNGSIAGNNTQVFSLGSAAVTPAALAEGFDSDPESDVVIVGDSEGFVHAFRITGDVWDESSGWPFDTGALLATHPVVVKTPDEIFIAVSDMEGRLHIITTDGEEAVGSPVSLDASSGFLGNLSVEADDQWRATGLFVLSGTDSGESARVTLYSLASVTGLLEEEWQHRVYMSGDELSGEIALLGGDIDPDETGNEVYVVSLETGRIILLGSGNILSERDIGSPLTGIPALQDINGDSYIDLVCSNGSRIYVVSPSGSNVTGWPRDIKEVFDLPSSVRITAPVTTVGTEFGAWVIAGTDNGILYIFDHRGELVSGYPKRIAGSFEQPVDIVFTGEEGLFSYIDYIRNYGYNAYYNFRPEGGTIRWRVGPFGNSGGGHSWGGIWGGPGRTAFAVNTGGFEEPAADWVEIDQNLVIYPNPSTGDRVGFHFTAPAGGEARLRIMTLSGELVYTEKKTLSGGQNEFAVSLSGKASGIYLCRLVMTSGGKRYEARKKFAIVN